MCAYDEHFNIHEATGEDLWMAVTRRRSRDDKMAYVVRPDYIHTTHTI